MEKMNLYPWQQTAAATLVGVLERQQTALDASDTGTGKTFTALDVMRQGGLRPLIVCPKAAIPTWRRVSEGLGTPILDALNPEQLKTGKFEYVGKGAARGTWYWTTKTPALIFDECHRFGGVKTQNAALMAAAKLAHIPVLCLSATVASSPLKMRALGYLLGLHHWTDFWSWTKRNGCYLNPWGGMDFTTHAVRREQVLHALHTQLFPAHGVRLRISEIPGFPDNEVIAESVMLSDKATRATNHAYDEAVRELEENKDTHHLTVLLRACQKAELQKTEVLLDMIEDTLDEGRSPVIFTRFRETQSVLLVECQKRFGDVVTCINGDQNEEQREAAITRFQTNNATIMLAMIQAGGVAISLHDLNGRPRTSFICPTYNEVELKQALGRIHRTGALSKAIQKIIFAAGTVEEDVCSAVRRKLDNLDLLNDGDLQKSIGW
jgi:superfamily II DNA or RNA helicase